MPAQAGLLEWDAHGASPMRLNPLIQYMMWGPTPRSAAVAINV